MPGNSIDRLAVMFTALEGIADISQHQGQQRSVEVLQQLTDDLSALAVEHAGEVVNLVGEEMLLLFRRADDALACACRMHRRVAAAPISDAGPLTLAVGIHHGVVYRKDGTQVFGDSINTAARVKSQCPAERILLTREAKLALDGRSTVPLRPFDRVSVKGKARPLVLFEVVWAPEDLNRTAPLPGMIDTGYLQGLSSEHLELTIAGETRTLARSMMPLTLGRGDRCDLPVDCESASRLHCRIEHQRGKFVLVDISTNGTQLLRSDGSSAIIWREEAVLTGRGHFALGTRPAPGAPCTIGFACD